MSDRLLTTTHRFEVKHPNAKQFRRALVLQKSRIEKDEIIARRIEVENEAATDSERVRWFNSLNEDGEGQREKQASKLMESELKMAQEELVKIRRAHLQKLLSDENAKHEKELNAMGKSFYKKRI
ncbi:hypothetical protein P5673_030933 [Acropora cervicornis]|uniref:Uncharacterized protein n=1 Tax=Acropora cervicornis TaxID=6130 RepID=A0AAD9PTI9_ACRCE|nr:hypothetical protein P5673_030933 [Acropora cervicornis]